MGAVMCHGPEDYRLEERRGHSPGRAKSWCGRVPAICASDIKCYTGAPLFWGDAHRPGYCQAPVTPGHEFVGEVVALGEGAGEKYGLAIGDYAASEQITPCWQCRYCRRGQYLDVPDPRYLRLPAEGVRLVGRVHAVAGERLELQGARATCRCTTPRSSSRWPARSTRSSAAISATRTRW